MKKQNRLLARESFRILLILAAAVVTGGWFLSLAQNSDDDPAIDPDEYAEIMAHQVENVGDLRAWVSNVQNDILPIIPPLSDMKLTQQGLPEILPFNPKSFPDAFLKGLAGVYENSVAVYPITIEEDKSTRALKFRDFDGREFFTLPAEAGYDPFDCIRSQWPSLCYGGANLDPARVIVKATLIESDNVEFWLYARDQIAAFQTEEEEGGGMEMMFLGPISNFITNITFTAFTKLTNGMSMTIAYTNNFTNGLDIFTCNDLLPEIWRIAVKSLPSTGTNLTWIDSNSWVDCGNPIRFYAVADAHTDTDADGYPDGRELLVYQTDPNAATSHPVKVSGTITYTGSETGTIYVLFATDSNCWSLAKSTELTGPGPYTNDEIGINHTYWFSAFRDINTSFGKDAWEPLGVYSNNSVLVTGDISGINITLRDVPSIWGQINYTGTRTGDIHVVAVTTSNSWDTTYETVIPWVQYVGTTGEEYHVSFPANYSIINVPVSNYWIRAFMDADTNGLASSLDPVGQYSTNSIAVSNRVTGISFSIAYDTDGDGFSDFAEANLYGTSVTVSNPAVSVAGTNYYTGTATNGTMWTLLSPTRFAWATNAGYSRTGSGAFAMTIVPGNATYWLKTFMDLNGNGRWDGSDVPGLSAPSRIVLTNISVSNLSLKVSKTRGMRVDFGYYYGSYWTNWAGKSAATIAGMIVTNAYDWGVNTIYARAYYPGGTYWPNPTTQYLTNEGSHGKSGILTQVVAKAHALGIKVVAWCQPLNAFLPAWNANPDWRYKDIFTNDWQPSEGWLTPFNTNVMNWLEHVVGEVLDQGVDGIDISETYYDSYSSNPTNVATYDAACRSNYFALYPGGTLGDSNWYRLRRDTLTSNLYGRIGQQVVASGKEFHVTFTWDANDSTGEPVSEDTYGTQTGFSYDDILNLPEDRRPNIVIPEFIWQGEATTNSYPSVFNPEWTIRMATQYVAFVKGRTLSGFHPEITLKTSVGTNKLPSLAQFESTLYYATTNTSGCDFFLHSLAITNNYLQNGTNVTSFGYVAVSNAFRGTE